MNASVTDEINLRLGELEGRTQERHTENLAANAQLIDEIRGMHSTVEDHVRADERSFEEIRLSLSNNTKLMNSVYSVVQKIEAAKTLGGWIKTGLHGLAAIMLSIAIIVAVVLWALGRGPFPAIHP